MREHNEFCAEIERRKNELIYKKKRRQKLLYGSIPAVLCLMVLAVAPWSLLKESLFGDVMVDPPTHDTSGIMGGTDTSGNNGDQNDNTVPGDALTEAEGDRTEQIPPGQDIWETGAMPETAYYVVTILTPQNKEMIFFSDVYALFEMLGQTDGVVLTMGKPPAYPVGTGATGGESPVTGETEKVGAATEELSPTVTEGCQTESELVETELPEWEPPETDAVETEANLTLSPFPETEITENTFGAVGELIGTGAGDEGENVEGIEYVIVIQTSSGELWKYSFSPELYEMLYEKISAMSYDGTFN